MAKQKLNTDTSIVDYLKSVGQDSSYQARKKLAQQYNISDYKGTSQQNTNMLNTLKGGNKPKVDKHLTEPVESKVIQPTIEPVLQPVEQQIVQEPEKNIQSFSSPSEYQSPYASQIDSILNNIMNRQPFNYNVNADPIYKQYNDAYTQSGNLAMRDSMGNAAGLTGGYGSSYGQSVGQQAYNQHMSQLNNVIPELYQAAYGRYQNEGDNQLRNLSALQGMEQQAYGKHRDTVGDYQTDRAFGYRQEQDSLAQQNLDRGFEYGKEQDDRAQGNLDRQFDYGKEQDIKGQQNIDREFDYGKQMDDWAQGNYLNDRTYNRSQDAIDRENYLKEFAHKQAQDKLAQENRDREYEYGTEQDILDSQNKSSTEQSKQSKERISKYSKTVDNMINATTADAFGIKHNNYTVEQVWEYLESLDLDDDEMAAVVNSNYELLKYGETKKGKGVTDSGRTYSYGSRSILPN